MIPLQGGGPELLTVLFFWIVVSVPLFLGVVVLLNRATSDDRGEEIAELRRRVDELESERD